MANFKKGDVVQTKGNAGAGRSAQVLLMTVKMVLEGSVITEYGEFPLDKICHYREK